MKTLTFAIAIILILMDIGSVYYLIKYWSTLNGDDMSFTISLASDYSTVAALGVVFLSKAMVIRTRSKSNRKLLIKKGDKIWTVTEHIYKTDM